VTLRDKIAREIRERGPIAFSRYMELCLYDAEFGYYSRNVEQFGKSGDFYTSSDVHAVFGRLMARQFEEIWRLFGSPGKIEVVELGPGRGLFAQDVLDWSEKKFPGFFDALHYSLIERSAALRQKLESTLSENLFNGNASLAECFLATETPAIVFANEFFDALPVEVLSSKGEMRIAEQAGRLVESWVPASAEASEFLDRYSVRPEADERIEAPLMAQHSMSQMAATMRRGIVLAIDYGYTQQEQLAGRHRGTIATYRKHSVSTNPFESPGEQDITAHVNFTALAAAAERNGMLAQSLRTQSQFLLGIGEQTQFADAFAECRLPQEHAKVALQLKHLITPSGMGETFHVLLASKGVNPEAVAKLSGLAFGV
jgi:SAM-dependent MidA family methyltransferase